jgi:hypothetical protein
MPGRLARAAIEKETSEGLRYSYAGAFGWVVNE